MTKEMTAGREMDVLIAENVMGWAVHQRNTAWWVKVADENEVTTEVMGFTYGKDRFAPSTNIADAWEVAGRLTKIQCGDDFYAFEITKKHYGWWVRVKHPLWMGIHSELGKNYEMHQAYADTAPLAICRCALKVAGVKINGDS